MVPSIGRRAIRGWAIKRFRTAESSSVVVLDVLGLSATVLLSVHLRNQAINDDRAGNAFGLRLEIGENTMLENRLCNRFEVLDTHKVAPLKHGVGFCPTNEIL